MQWIAALAALVPVLAWSAPAAAQEAIGQRTVVTASWVEEWDPALGRWVRVDESGALDRARVDQVPVVDAQQAVRTPLQTIANRFAAGVAPAREPAALAQYGPFLVLDAGRAAVIGSTDGSSPAHFDAMMRDFPGLRTLEMIEAPGTSHDIANLAVGRRIRAHGLNTHVPGHGSVRSGAVELFLAGAQRSVEPGAQFAVHSWIDTYGREPRDFAPDDPANRLYLDYYRDMGMSESRARAFYAMTNSVPHHSAKWLNANDMLPWIGPENTPRIVIAPPVIPIAPLPRALVQPLPDALAVALASDSGAFDAAPLIGYGNLALLAAATPDAAQAKPFLDS